MEWTDTALVLRVGRFRETDLWVRLLARRRGLISAFAFGASRSRRRFPGCLDLLNVIRVRAKDTRGGAYLNLEEGTLLEGPRRLRQDWRRLGMLMNCVRFLEALGVNPENA
ncbi:MAG: recombination protein O N-terminal domain-containing protein, partial [Deltaproteobacteria bacterium]|nr:recombination protein O N-terminal domain-containing protein [Deltaproteobacteria bacterium]